MLLLWFHTCRYNFFQCDDSQQQHCVSHFTCDILLTCFRIAWKNRARASCGMRISRINDYWSIATRSGGRSPDMNICRILFIHNADGKQIAVSSSRLFVSIRKPCKYTRDIGFSFTCRSNRGASNKGTGFILSMLSSCPRNMDADLERILLFTRHIAHCARVAAAGSVIKFSFANSFETGTAGACEYVRGHEEYRRNCLTDGFAGMCITVHGIQLYLVRSYVRVILQQVFKHLICIRLHLCIYSTRQLWIGRNYILNFPIFRKEQTYIIFIEIIFLKLYVSKRVEKELKIDDLFL